MKEHYFQYAVIVLVIILALMLFGAVIYIGILQAENEFLTQENQRLTERVDEINEEIESLSDRIREITRDVNDSEDWNKGTF